MAQINFTIPCKAGLTTNAYCVIGKNNAGAFQACVNAAQANVAAGDTNDIINIADGKYLIASVPKCARILLKFTRSIFNTFPAVTVTSGGITFAGQSEAGTVLMGCGAGMDHPCERWQHGWGDVWLRPVIMYHLSRLFRCYGGDGCAGVRSATYCR